MENAQWKSYAAHLRAKAAELTAELQHRDGLMLEPEPDVFDQVQSAADRNLVIHALDRNSALLREIRAALDRIKDGTYGCCVNCDETIGPKRLSAAPWAARCLKCQELADREQTEKPAGPLERAPSMRDGRNRGMAMTSAA
jgi:DnaK suppressor protein